MSTVMAFGTFDVLHKGHLDYFRQAKQLGDFLIVVIARESNIIKTKGRPPLQSENQRLKQIKNLNIVDKALLGSETDKFAALEKYKPDIVCFGYDQKIPSGLLEQIKKAGIKTFRLKPFKPEKYKSSLVKKLVRY